jgi:protease IV
MEQAPPKKRRFVRKLLAVAVVVGLVVWACAWLFGPAALPARAILVLQVGDALRAAPSGALERLFFGEGDPALPDLYTALTCASADPRVEGLVLDLRGGALGLADARELRRLLAEFRKERKQVIAYADDLSFRAWYVASACDKIVLNPAGYLRLTGTALRVLCFGDLLKRLRLKADLERVGRYKTAAETMTDNKLSPASREALGRVSDRVWDQLILELADARKLDRASLEETIDQGPVPARTAQERKLVDALKWRDELEDYVKNAIAAAAELVPFARYAEHARRAAGGAQIAYLPLVGTIVGGGTPGDGIIAADAAIAHLAALGDNAKIGAIVVRVDSPGGDALASARLYRAIKAARLKKPVVVSMGASAASAATTCRRRPTTSSRSPSP